VSVPKFSNLGFRVPKFSNFVLVTNEPFWLAHPQKIILKLWRLSKLEVSILKVKIECLLPPFGPPLYIYISEKSTALGRA
jgi:hypothetical protein